jgi:hypothetical protein
MKGKKRMKVEFDDTDLPDNYKRRNWVFTWNNPSDSSSDTFPKEACVNQFLDFVNSHGGGNVCIGLEHGEENGTEHLQGVFHLSSSSVSFKVIKSHFPGCHFESCRSLTASIKYCCKEKVLFNNFPADGCTNQGHRTDLDLICSEILSGQSNVSEIARSYPKSYVLHSKGLLDLFHTVESPLRKEHDVTWIFGESNSGKTTFALRNVGALDFVVIVGGSRFFNGYESQSVVVFDDLRKDFEMNRLLNLIGSVPSIVEVKGSWRYFNPSSIKITCNFDPLEFCARFYPTEDPIQLVRRLSSVWKCSFVDNEYIQEQIDLVKFGFLPGVGKILNFKNPYVLEATQSINNQEGFEWDF